MFAPAYASGGSQSFQIKKDQFKYFVIERQNEKEVAYGKSTRLKRVLVVDRELCLFKTFQNFSRLFKTTPSILFNNWNA